MEQMDTMAEWGWTELPSRREDIRLPVRRGLAREFANKSIDISTNHMPLKITLPEEIYMYEIRVKRLPGDEEGLSPKRKKPKEDGSEPDLDLEVTRALPKRLLQKILKCFLVQLTQKYEKSKGCDIGLVSDFVQKLYSTKKLEEMGNKHSIDMSPLGLSALRIPDPDPEELENGTFIVNIKPTDWKINTKELAKQMNNMRGVNNSILSCDLAAMYNAVVKSMPNYKYLAIGKSMLIKFPQPGQDGRYLQGGLTCWPGISALITPGWKYFLNVELAYSTMLVGEPVISALSKFYEVRTSECVDVTQWSEKELRDGTGFLKSAKVYYTPSAGVKRGGTIDRIHRKPPSKATFIKDGVEVTVQKYYKDTYGCSLTYPNGPLLVFSGKGCMVPAELCTIKSGQSVNRKLNDKQTREMVNVARKYPNQLEKDIVTKTKEMELDRNVLFKKFGMEVDHKMLNVQCRVLEPPTIIYGRSDIGRKGSEIVPQNGVWSTWRNNNVDFKKPALEKDTRKWAILIIKENDREGINMDGPRNFAAALSGAGRKCGLSFSSHPTVEVLELKDKSFGDESRDKKLHQKNVEELRSVFKSFKRHENAFAVVVLPKKPSKYYGQVKQAAELSKHGIGLMTQCIICHNFIPRAPKRMDANSSTIQQLLLKMNSKFNGINHAVALSPTLIGRFDKIDLSNMRLPILIMGADVTHPQPGSGTRDMPAPSFACVTGSLDGSGMPYMMKVQAQHKAGRGAAETIGNLENIVKDFINDFFRRNSTLPWKLIYYRDGVGEGQFKELLHVELRGIRKACATFDCLNKGVPYRPKITFMVVQKRHKTRFFHHVSNGKTENAPPGTVLDSHIVHPTETDFYLLSHAAIQGTSRPTRYHVLWDDSEFTQDEIQILTYYMCHNYARCNRAVKLPAPTYYAHWGAARAKSFAEGQEHLYSDLDTLNRRLERSASLASEYPMHFI